MVVVDEVFQESSSSPSLPRGTNMEVSPPIPGGGQAQLTPRPTTTTAPTKRTVNERSPENMDGNARSVRHRMNEFDLGNVFEQIEKKMREKVGQVVETTPEDLKVSMKRGLDVMMSSMLEVMSHL